MKPAIYKIMDVKLFKIVHSLITSIIKIHDIVLCPYEPVTLFWPQPPEEEKCVLKKGGALER